MNLGHLKVTAEIGEGTVAIRHNYQRPLKQISTLLQSSPPEKACDLLPVLFSVCGNSHKVAGLLANDLMKGQDKGFFSQKIMLENLRESVFRLLNVWSYPAEPKNSVLITQLLGDCLSLPFEQSNQKIAAELTTAWQDFVGSDNHFSLWLNQLYNTLTNDYCFIDESNKNSESLIEKYSLDDCKQGLDYLNSTLPVKVNVDSGVGISIFFDHNVSLLEKFLLAAVAAFCQTVDCVTSLLSLCGCANTYSLGGTYSLGSTSKADAPFFQKCVSPGIQEGHVLTSRGWLQHTVSQKLGNESLTDKIAVQWDIHAPTDINFGGQHRSVFEPLEDVFLKNNHSNKWVGNLLTKENKDILQPVEKLVSWYIKAIDPCLAYSVEARYA